MSYEISGTQSLWDQSLDVVEGDVAAQTLVGQVNLRVDVAKAMKAVYFSVKLYAEGHLVLATGAITPYELLKLAKGTWDVVTSTLNALRETLSELNYCACVVLSAAPGAVSEAEFEAALTQFLNSCEPAKLPWYMGFTNSFITEARKAASAPSAFVYVLKYLREKDWVTEADGKLQFKPRHFSWGFTSK